MPKKPTRKPAAKPQARSAKPRAATPTSTKAKHVPTRGLYSWITHTDLASRDPAATKAWCAKVLGWSFRPPFTSPAGEYHLFTYSEQGGGGIHGLGPGEGPGAVPFVHVADAHAAFDAALRAGAEAVHPPERVMEGVTAAQVRAPGGVIIGFSGP